TTAAGSSSIRNRWQWVSTASRASGGLRSPVTDASVSTSPRRPVSVIEPGEQRLASAGLRSGLQEAPRGGRRQPLLLELRRCPELLPQARRGGGHDGVNPDGDDPQELGGGVQQRLEPLPSGAVLGPRPAGPIHA